MKLKKKVKRYGEQIKDQNIGNGRETVSDKKLKKDMTFLGSKCMPKPKQ